MESFITLHPSNIAREHICCAFSDKKCKESYELKKEWLTREFANGYVFRRLDARAKVFMEYGPAEHGWAPVDAPNYLLVNCFWVSGQYKEKGYGKELLRLALEDARVQGKDGLVTIVGTSKFHFMSDTKWLLKQGFVTCDSTPTGFSLLVLKLNPEAPVPVFRKSVKEPVLASANGLLAYYSHRCPFAEYYVASVLKETAASHKLPLTVVHLSSAREAQNGPTPATIFSLYYNGTFLTTDLSVCLDNRMAKLLEKVAP